MGGRAPPIPNCFGLFSNKGFATFSTTYNDRHGETQRAEKIESNHFRPGIPDRYPKAADKFKFRAHSNERYDSKIFLR